MIGMVTGSGPDELGVGRLSARNKKAAPTATTSRTQLVWAFAGPYRALATQLLGINRVFAEGPG